VSILFATLHRDNGILTLPSSAADMTRRYVAEENIEVKTAQPSPALMLQAGQWFKRWDPLLQRFVSNIQDEYPDD
jgi:hypothetical protein